MSHTVRVKYPFDDLECLEKAGRDLGLDFVDEQMYRYYGADIAPCEYLFRAIDGDNETYEIGIVKNPEGGYELEYDTSFGEQRKIVGENANLLRQRYTVQVGMKDRIQQGYRVWEERHPVTGRPRVLAER